MLSAQQQQRLTRRTSWRFGVYLSLELARRTRSTPFTRSNCARGVFRRGGTVHLLGTATEKLYTRESKLSLTRLDRRRRESVNDRRVGSTGQRQLGASCQISDLRALVHHCIIYHTQ